MLDLKYWQYPTNEVIHWIVKNSSSQEIKGSVLERHVSWKFILLAFFYSLLKECWLVIEMLSADFCKHSCYVYQKLIKFFPLLSNEGITLVGSCLWNSTEIFYSLLLSLCVFFLNNAQFYSAQKNQG